MRLDVGDEESTHRENHTCPGVVETFGLLLTCIQIVTVTDFNCSFHVQLLYQNREKYFS